MHFTGILMYIKKFPVISRKSGSRKFIQTAFVMNMAVLSGRKDNYWKHLLVGSMLLLNK